MRENEGNALIPCRTIGGVVLKRNDTCKALLIDEDLIVFTPTEYRLLCALLDENIVEDETLIKVLCNINQVDRSTRKLLERHLENVKSKLRSSRLYICRVHGYGYSLIAETSTA